MLGIRVCEVPIVKKVVHPCAGATAGYFLRNRALQGSTQQLTYIAGIVALNIFLGASPGSMIDNSGALYASPRLQVSKQNRS